MSDDGEFDFRERVARLKKHSDVDIDTAVDIDHYRALLSQAVANAHIHPHSSTMAICALLLDARLAQIGDELGALTTELRNVEIVVPDGANRVPR